MKPAGWIITLFWATSAFAQVTVPPIASPAPIELPTAAIPSPPPGIAPTPMPNPGAVPAASTTTPVATPSPTTPEQAPEMERLLSYKSVMYSKEELEQLAIIIDAVKNNQPLPGQEEVSARTESGQPMPTQAEYYYFPQFYLKSIAYYSADNWVVWVNDNKITSVKPDAVEGLKVTQISPEQVEFQYAFLPDDHMDFSTEPEDERITINPFNRSATFLLNPNQTFSSYNWKIFEGKVKQARQNLNAKPQQPSVAGGPSGLSDVFPSNPPAPQLPSPSGMPKNANTPASGTGIGGLINRYKNMGISSP